MNITQLSKTLFFLFVVLLIPLTSFVFANTPPVADAGPDQSVENRALVTLDGSGSSDLDGHRLNYSWQFVQIPVGSAAVLIDSTTVSPSFRAGMAGNYKISLRVSDASSSSRPSVVEVFARNTPPQADAGSDQFVAAGDSVTLDGTGSSDPDGDPIEYSWRLVTSPPGSSASLTGETTATPRFTADSTGRYVARLVVSDTTNYSNASSVAITATDQTAPLNTTSSQFVNKGQDSTISGIVTLNIAASDENEVAGYYYSESPATPDAFDPGWINIRPLQAEHTSEVIAFLSSGLGTKTITVWLKDLAGNISAPVSDSIEVVEAEETIFGAHTPIAEESYNQFSQMGVGWVRLSGLNSLSWDLIESNRDGNYNWQTIDTPLQDLAGQNILPFLTIRSLNNSDAAQCREIDNPDQPTRPYDSMYPCDIEAYKRFIRAAVSRYGDNFVYQLGNEIYDTKFWNDTPQNYALLLKETSLTIKEICPTCNVSMAGVVRSDFKETDFWSAIFSELKSFPECETSDCFDIFDIHDVLVGGRHTSLTNGAVREAKNLMVEYEFVKPLWATELGALAGSIAENSAYLAKSFVSGLEQGFEKFFWRAAEECCQLFADGRPTLAYDAYQTVINTVGTPNSVEKLQEWQYKITREDDSVVYAVWCESGTCLLDNTIANLGTVSVTSYDGVQQTMDSALIDLTENSVIFIERSQ